MDKEEIKALFSNEFKSVADKFEIYDLPVVEAEKSTQKHIIKPGVYVFWHRVRGVIKVGRHLTNARKRAFEHLYGNTGGVMGDLKNDTDATLLLFCVKDPTDRHWLAALEIYFEEHTSPEVKADRLG